ncbi:type II toxin-antitoxin system VapC family toxin [Gloeobacter morelensis]|uniref:Type II toxin-antitoxin system VapC family toxin n=1 Tax=Gloeobacter morelensis MG652769 TaxID=2781736 RepID=A0ABY3PRR1_9CYAN|nr:type II toxin-antitoxin system VapC family toxin [Gloeobacter morelensis]UFP96209.1 type II toxin-antitoxin system VapC family toxin [Gloeobacter morelensis MG652769]
MSYLLDTHAFLWFISGDTRLSTNARTIIENEGNEIYLSVASIWEISIKARLGRLELIGSPEKVIQDNMDSNGFICLPIEKSHALQIYNLPDHHRDPFDRILIAQSQVESLILITTDYQIKQYNIATIW